MIYRAPTFARRIIAVSAVLAAGGVAMAQSLTVTTLAGSRQTGSVDGVGTAARFNSIRDLVADANGGVYVVDNYTVRYVSASGVVSTYAGTSDSAGLVDGSRSTGRFAAPSAITRDDAGTLYVGDQGYVRKVSSTGAITTLDLASGFPEAAPGLAYRFSSVWGLGFDQYRNLYVGASTAVHKVGYLDGVLTTVAGAEYETGNLDSFGTLARLGIVSAVAVNGDGTVYVADDGNHTIRKISPLGIVTTIAGAAGLTGTADGTGNNARFTGPYGVALNSDGNLLVGDGLLLRLVDVYGTVTTLAGSATAIIGTDGRVTFPDGVGSAVRFSSASKIAVGPNRVIFIADGSVLRTAMVVTVAPSIASHPQAQSGPVATAATFTVLADGAPAVQYRWQRQINGQGDWFDLTDGATFSGTTTRALKVSPLSMDMTGDRFRCVVTNALGQATSGGAALTVDPPVVIVPLNVTTFAGNPQANGGVVDGQAMNARFSGPSAVTVDAAGNIFTTDNFGHALRKITPSGTVTTFAGNGQAGSTDGVGTAAQFYWPDGIVTDASGNLYVADAGNSTIRKVARTGAVTTVAGLARTKGVVDGVGIQARFNSPANLALDPAGNIYVTDSQYTRQLRRVTPAGVVTTVATIDTVAPGTAGLSRWGGMACDAAGVLYFANTNRHTIETMGLDGKIVTIAGKLDSPGATDGQAFNARFNGPTGIAVDRAGNLYVTESGNSCIRKISPAGVVSTIAGLMPSAGTTSTAGWANGIGSAARFNFPAGLVVNAGGTLYIADRLNRAIRRATPVSGVSVGQTVELYAPTESGYSAASTGFDALTGRTTMAAQTSTYQWTKNGTAIVGATSATYRIDAATAGDAGEYAVGVLANGAIVSSAGVAVRVDRSRLINLSIRSVPGTGSDTLIVGFAVDGGGIPVLLRGVGPGLADYGVAGPLSDPKLALYEGTRWVGENSNWQTALEATEVANRVSAFPLVPGSADAAIVTTAAAGTFTAQCASTSGRTGVALVELYDASAGTYGNSRFVNLSARSKVGTGEQIMVAGFSIVGTGTKTLLVRGVGPRLADFGVPNAISNPQLKVYDSGGTVIASNDNWSDASNAVAIGAAVRATGAFDFDAGSKDAALLLTLSPGTYSVHLSGVGNVTGVGLVEVYEIE